MKPVEDPLVSGKPWVEIENVSQPTMMVFSEVLQLWRLDLISWLLRCSDVPYPIDFRTVQVAPV
jgi:hypothetical protein